MIAIYNNSRRRDREHVQNKPRECASVSRSRTWKHALEVMSQISWTEKWAFRLSWVKAFRNKRSKELVLVRRHDTWRNCFFSVGWGFSQLRVSYLPILLSVVSDIFISCSDLFWDRIEFTTHPGITA